MVLLTTIVERSCGTELGLTAATISLHVMLNELPRELIAHVSEVTEVQSSFASGNQKRLVLLLGKGSTCFIDLCIIMTKTNIATTTNQPDKPKEYVKI